MKNKIILMIIFMILIMTAGCLINPYYTEITVKEKIFIDSNNICQSNLNLIKIDNSNYVSTSDEYFMLLEENHIYLVRLGIVNPYSICQEERILEIIKEIK
jgi:hypothetical protein